MTQDRRPETTEDAIWAIYSGQVRLEQSIHGVPGTADRGLFGAVEDVKNLVVEEKDKRIDLEKRVAAQEGKCKALHGSGGNTGFPPTVSRKRFFSFLGSLVLFVSGVLYNLGVWLGWFPPPSN
jgi:hypothetical protein